MVIVSSVVILISGLILTVLWLWPELQILPTIVIDDNTPYLLSAIAQSLAAILALVFTILFIVAQLSSRYSYRMMARVFDRLTIAYIFLFVVAVILPLLLLTDPNVNGVIVSIILTVVCILLLIPYLMRFSNKLNPEHMLLTMKQSAIKKIQRSLYNEPSEIIVIDNTIMSAFAMKDYDTLNRGVSALSDLAGEFYAKWSNDTGESNLAGKDILKRLEDIGLITIQDPRAPIYVLDALGKFSKVAIQNNWDNATEQAAKILGTIGKKANEAKLQDTVITIVSIIGDIARNSIRKQEPPDFTGDVADILSEAIGLSAIDNEQYTNACHVVELLRDCCCQSIDEGKYSVAGRYEYSLLVMLDGAGKFEPAVGVEQFKKNQVSEMESEIIIEFTQKEPKGLHKIGEEIVYALLVIKDEAIAKYERSDIQPRLLGIINRAISAISSVGIQAMEMKLRRASDELYYHLEVTGKTTAEKGIEDVTRRVIDCMHEMILSSRPGSIDKISELCTSLVEIGAWVNYHTQLKLQKHVIDLIQNLGQRFVPDVMEKAFSNAKSNIAASNNPTLEKSLEQFVLSYEQTLKKTP